MSNAKEGGSGGIGVLGLLGIAFVVLKLCGVIAWSWWWVTAPFWSAFLLWFAAVFVITLSSVARRK